MSDKPSYLGLLNALALAESAAFRYLSEWAVVTPDPRVRQVLLTVAAREGEHGMSFAKRINELGYELRLKPNDREEFALDLVRRTDCSDREKMEALGLDKLDTGDQPDVFDGLFSDHSIDIRTGELLGRYICEERDTARLLKRCWEQLCASEAAEPRPAAKAKPKAKAATKKSKPVAKSGSAKRRLVAV